jgi:hypothetical protein
VLDIIERELSVVLIVDTLVKKLPQRGLLGGDTLRVGLQYLDVVLLIVHVTDHAFEADQLLVQHFDLMRGGARV